MINDNITALLETIKRLERQLETELDKQQAALSYHLQNHRVRFADAMCELHRQYKMGLIEFFRTADISHILVSPIIYSLIVPLIALDIAVSIYQHVCFRSYGIPRVRRSDYIILDHHHLAYLNAIEKLNCSYCSYANGLIAYVREVTARTEQYWCPIKHARKIRTMHSRYHKFVEYGDGEYYQQRLAELRKSFDDLVEDS